MEGSNFLMHVNRYQEVLQYSVIVPEFFFGKIFKNYYYKSKVGINGEIPYLHKNLIKNLTMQMMNFNI